MVETGKTSLYEHGCELERLRLRLQEEHSEGKHLVSSVAEGMAANIVSTVIKYTRLTSTLFT
jgi:hypothetical protein